MYAVLLRLRSYWRGLRRPSQVDADMDSEMRFHIDMEAQRLMRRHGFDAAEARRQALIAFGGMDKYREAGRDALRLTATRGLSVDVKLAVRMLLKYPGLTLAGGLALAIAIGVGAGWYDLTRDLLRPTLPLPDGDRIVEVGMRNVVTSADERRLLHDLLYWRQQARTIEDLGAYRTLERNLILGDARPEPVTVAETTASAFRLARVPPVLGRPLLEADEQPGAPAVVVLGHSVWQQRFGGRADIVGRTVQLGHVTTAIVGVMPEGFAFPVNHGLWVPLQLQRSGYAPLEGPAIRVFGRLAPDTTQAQASAELTALTARVAAESRRTHERLRPRVLAYGGQSPGDRSWMELAITHLPILLVLIVACVNVGTLIYARTAAREAEIAMRYVLGASRGRIVGQLFLEALVLASAAGVVGLVIAHEGLKWGVDAYYSGQNGGAPFWVNPGLKLTTVLYAAALTVAGAAALGILPALKATGARVQGQIASLGGTRSTMRFGRVWTAAMIAQVGLTVICLPPAMGISHEAWRDRIIRDKFPAEEYLAFRLALDEEAAARIDSVYGEFERRIAREADVVAITFADRLPGMSPDARRAEAEVSPASAPVEVPSLWTAAVGPRFFQAFDVPIVAGRDFENADRVAGSRTVIVNEAFARLYMGGASPVGARVRFASADPASPEPWLEIVGVARDIGMTPTDQGEAPYVFTPVSPATADPLVVGVRTSGEPSTLAPRVRAIAANLDPSLRLDDMRSLDDHVWRVDVPQMVATGAIVAVVCLGLFLSAAGIFSLLSVSVARQTREIGLRAALGASQARLLGGIFTRALLLVGCGIAAGNGVLLLFVTLATDVTLADVGEALLITSAIMLTTGLVACVEPARRALRIHPTDALREA